MSVKDHLSDIDFRTREARQADAITDFIKWYEDLHRQLAIQFTSGTNSQLQMLTSVLWYLLPKADYKKLTRRKPQLNEALAIE